jgi:hypothetical protein
MSPLHYCEYCKNPIYDIKAPSCIRLVEAWIKGGGKTIQRIHQERYSYFHEACWGIEHRKSGQEESLF